MPALCSINDYANSMFRREQLPNAWLDSCTAYVRHLFGDSLKGKTVLDYAFGRGNWSLAFMNAGAESVIAVDASEDNVSRFQAYCRENGITGIDIRHGNILDAPLDVKADLLWLYGIVHHIPDRDRFLKDILSCARNSASQIYLYYYNADSLREFTVQTCRQVLQYPDEASFLKDSPLFLQAAYLRARDDLVAPHVDFQTVPQLQAWLSGHGLHLIRQDRDFHEYLHQQANAEFYPHQLLCGFGPTSPVSALESFQPDILSELELLRQLSSAVFNAASSAEERKKLAIGLFNSHFAGCQRSFSDIDVPMHEITLFLTRHLVQSPDTPTDTLSAYLDLCQAALLDIPREHLLEQTGANRITRYLAQNRIRL